MSGLPGAPVWGAGKNSYYSKHPAKKHSMVTEGDHCFREKYSLYFSGFIEGGDKKSYVAEGV